MRMIDSMIDRRVRPAAAGAHALALAAALPLAGCGSDKPPPLTGNLVDARGAHAGSFRSADEATTPDGNGAAATPPANTQDTPR